ncbi:HPP family protein [Amycolatopsis sp. FDAARGOS 1241]|uniref:CBS domain-containing protein n=1 Tax=Amycolatopsis sp. FDAARGOS 1241 TaxID=2778070 RepID=UPI001EF17247|nr:CBS domain-containing protein [Amycolatopsis sp. FDAARGOS 1241]
MQTRDIMTTPVIAVTPSTSLAEAAGVMTERGFTTMPVVDHTGKLVGLVTEADVAQAGLPGAAGENRRPGRRRHVQRPRHGRRGDAHPGRCRAG